MKNSVLSLSFQFIAQTKPDRCDVVFGGKKEGFMSKKNIVRVKRINFYNKFCKCEIMGYSIYYIKEGKAAMKNFTDPIFTE